MPEDAKDQPQPTLLDEARAVLAGNDHGVYTAPAPYLYPHQWLWDSCFVSIGLAHDNLDRAQQEIESLFDGQWSNGMMPNIIFQDGIQYQTDRNVWRSWANPHSPDHVSTSGITQPPMVAEAVVRIGTHMKAAERRTWYSYAYPKLLAYHEWLYRERDPHNEGLTLQIHPWETGLDNTPPWMDELHGHLLPTWIRFLEKTGLEKIIGWLRRDTRFVAATQRMSNVDSLALFAAQHRLRRKAYDTDKILNRSLFAIEDLSYNSILIRANEHLSAIAKDIKKTIPSELAASMKLTRDKLESLWDPYAKEYYSRDFATHRLIKVSSIAGLMPLYAGNITKERAAELVRKLENDHWFGPAYPVPSVPISSDWFDVNRYWQGPSWVNMNWLLIDGLTRYGYTDHAAALRESTIEMVDRAGFYEYFNPLTGEGLGIEQFSWTAALIIDLLEQKN